MRDLEIRGAGNLLGGEQTGFILEMGFEMYEHIVEEAVAELKEEEFNELVEDRIGIGKKAKVETVIETDIEVLIPDIYIEHDSERLDIYRRLYRCESLEDINMMREELKDRFGEYPEEVEHLFQQIALKVIAAKIGFIKMELNNDVITLHFPPPDEKTFYEGNDAKFQNIIRHIYELKSFHPHLTQDKQQLKLTARIKFNENQTERLDEAKAFLEKLMRLSELSS